LKHRDVLNAKNALGQEARKHDSKEGIGRVESRTETENNAGAIIEELFSARPDFPQHPWPTDFSRLIQ